MAVTLASLLNARTRVQWRDLLLTELTAAGFAVALAPSGDNRRNVVEFVSAGLEKVDRVIAAIAAGAVLRFAQSDWLHLRAESGYDVEFNRATVTRGTVRLTCALTAGPYVISGGTLWVGRAASGSVPARRYQNVNETPLALASGGFVDVPVSAEFPGSAHNLGIGLINTLFTSLSGVSVSNPAIGLTGDWITTRGTDDEADEALKTRARARWGTLGRGGNDAAFVYIAATASPEVSRVRVYPGPGDGTVLLVLASPTGGVSGAAVAAVQASLASLKPLTDAPAVRSATVTTVAVLGTVYARASRLAAAQTEADAKRLELLATLDIGEGVDLGALYEILRRPGVTDVDITQPAGDTAIAYDAVAGIDLSAVVWVGV